MIFLLSAEEDVIFLSECIFGSMSLTEWWSYVSAGHRIKEQRAGIVINE